MIDMIDVIINIIESFLMSYFCIRYFNIEYHKIRTISIMTVILTITVTISNHFVPYDVWLPFFDVATITCILYFLEKKHSIYEKIFISILILLLIQIACNITIFIVALLFQIEIQYAVSYNFESFIVSAIISRIILFILIWYVSKLKNSFITNMDNHVWKILIIISGVVLICENYLSELVYTEEIQYFNLYLVMFGFGIMSIAIFYLFIKIKIDSEKQMLREIELSQLKQIETQYIELKSLKERNDKIKHDLKYFLDIINNQRRDVDVEELPRLLTETIENIDKNNYYVYSNDKVFNSMLNTMKIYAQGQNKQIFFSIAGRDIAVSVEIYELISTLSKNIIDISKMVRFSSYYSGGYHVFEFHHDAPKICICNKNELEKIIKKYDGLCIEDTEGNKNKISIYLKL